MKPFSAKKGVPGFLFSGISSGIKKAGKDLGLIMSATPFSVAGVFTKNRVKAAPVLLCKKRVANGTVQAVLANSGNANACTGRQGATAAAKTCAAVAGRLGIHENLVAPCSTGVIGVPLPVPSIVHHLPALITNASSAGIPDFAEAIMTTDSFPKIVTLQHTVDEKTVKMCGIAKGAGMIMPDMATMLAFVVTNAAVDRRLLGAMLKSQVNETFNRITVDGDMSTNDTVLVLANGCSESRVGTRGSKAGRACEEMLHRVMKKLALMIVKDGEGATKLLTITVHGAKTQTDAKKSCFAVANSNLVKTAFFGEDFNWGRIMGALGSSGAVFDPAKVALYFNDIPAVSHGMGVLKNSARLKRAVKKRSINVKIDLSNGTHSFEVATCDLSYDYVRINADYTT